MGAEVSTKMCCGEAGGGAMNLVNLERGLGPGGLLKDVPLQGMGMCAEDHRYEAEVDLDYDASLSVATRPHTKEAAATRRQMFRAARQDDAPAMLQLVADGADLTDASEALRLAAYRGSTTVVRELVAVGLGVNEACPETGLTPLQLAAGCGHLLVCELLLDAMADPTSARGPPAISLAKRKGHQEVEEVIERHMAALALSGKGEELPDQYKRAHVLPRVSPLLSEAVMQALPPVPQQEPDAAAGGEGTGADADASGGPSSEGGECMPPSLALVPQLERSSSTPSKGPL